ncbi:MAG: nitroreductase family protein [candidate division Zixibacteria bacterium]|nr:nitroreductase family protein [candidate division Zixibacteria bacterium]
MNELLRLLQSHASVRQFTGEQITNEQERIIIETAQRSATSSNLQAYSIIGIRNQSTKDELAKLTGGQSHVAESSLFLIFCADLYRLSLLNKTREYPFHGEYTEVFIVATVDAALAADRALVAAQALGLGGVMVGGIRNNPVEVGRLVNLPELVYPVMGMSLGYPPKTPKAKPRLPMDGIYHRETYSSEQFESVVMEYDKTIHELGYLKGREVNRDNYKDFDDLYSWSEHSARRMATTDQGTLRGHMLGYLKERGFLRK